MNFLLSFQFQGEKSVVIIPFSNSMSLHRNGIKGLSGQVGYMTSNNSLHIGPKSSPPTIHLISKANRLIRLWNASMHVR